VKCSLCTDELTCTACDDGFVIINNMCESCPAGTYFSKGNCLTNPYTNTTGEILGAAQAGTKAASQVANLLSSGSPAGISAGVSGKIFSNIKYLNITYSDELEQALLTWDKDLISLGFELDLPGKVDGMLKDEPLPYNFEKYEVRSSFLANNWQNILMLLVIIGIYVLARGIQWFAKSQNVKYFNVFRAIRIMIQNFLLTQLYGVYGDLIFFCVLDWRSVDKNISLSDISLTISCFMMIVLIVNLVLHYKLLKKYQRVRLKALETNNDDELEDFKKDHEGNQVLFRDFKDQNLNQQMFLFYFTIRDLLFSLILTTLFDHPISQTVLMLLMTLAMVVYLFISKPFEEPIDFIQQLCNEAVTIVVVSFVFGQAIMDRMGMERMPLRVRLGKGIILLNIIFNYMSLAFMGFKVLLILRDGYRAYKTYKAKKISITRDDKKLDSMGSMKSSISNLMDPSTQMSLVDDSPVIRPRPRHGFPQLASSFTVDSFIKELAEDLANPDFLNNNGVPQKTTAPLFDESAIHIISLDSDRPLVLKKQESMPVEKKPAAPLFAMGYRPYEATTVVNVESSKTESLDLSLKKASSDLSLKKASSSEFTSFQEKKEVMTNPLMKSLKTPGAMLSEYLKSFTVEKFDKKAPLSFGTKFWTNNKDLDNVNIQEIRMKNAAAEARVEGEIAEKKVEDEIKEEVAIELGGDNNENELILEDIMDGENMKMDIKEEGNNV